MKSPRLAVPTLAFRAAMIFALGALLAASGCRRKPAASAPKTDAEPLLSATPAAPSSPAKPASISFPLPPAEIWKQFSGEKAFEETRRQVELGPRPAGSPELEKARVLIEQSLRSSGWEVERQSFSAETPRGEVQFANLIARFTPRGSAPSAKTPQAIVCSHYDTKLFSTIRFVGASDGASSTGALLELARVLSLDPKFAAKIELVFFDGEEAFVQFDETDGLYGSRHYANELRKSGRAAQFRFGVLWDMIGDRDLTITLSPDSPAALMREVLVASDALGFRGNFSVFDRDIYDDHVPLNTIAHIPTIDLIDFDYPPWHTADDTLERLSPESLQKVGAVTLFHLRTALGK